MIPEYGGNVRRTSQAAADALLDENADIVATEPQGDGTDQSDTWPRDPVWPPSSPDAVTLPFSETLDPALVPPPPEPPPPEPPALYRRSRLDLVAPILLAGLGLAAALIAWRVGVASNIADDANRAGIEAARQRAVTVITDEGVTSRSMDAFLDFERDRRRADALAAAGANDQAQVNRMAAAAFWGDVAAQYLDRAGQFQPNQQRAALLAEQEQSVDIQPLGHFEVADAAYRHMNDLILAGLVVALALPFLTLAEIGRGRLRGVSILVGTGIFGAGVILAISAWI